MNAQNVNIFMMTHSKYFPPAYVPDIQNRIAALDDDKYALINSIELKEPTFMLLFSIFLGQFGVDRFLMNEIGMGILKLLTAGCCGVLWLIDIIMISDKTREYNYSYFISIIQNFR